MDEITTRAIIIAVNIFVTIAIVTVLILTFGRMKEIYKVVASTDNSIYSKFNNVYDMYNGKVETGIGLLNAIKKYKDDDDIVVKYPNKEAILQTDLDELTILKEKMKSNDETEYRYENRYNVIVYNDDENGNTVIDFTLIE